MGTADAINKGLRHASGEIIGCLSADDIFYPGAVAAIVRHFAEHPGCMAAYGRYVLMAEDGSAPVEQPTVTWDYDQLQSVRYCRQPAAFWRKAVTASEGVFDERLQFVFDYEFWLRIGLATRPEYFGGQILAGIRQHRRRKTCVETVRAHEETLDMMRGYATSPAPVYAWLRRLARHRAATDCLSLGHCDESDRRFQRAYITWLLVYAERYEIALDETVLMEVDAIA
jgi:glycosyltransferase involved in cell wall biosynthesis